METAVRMLCVLSIFCGVAMDLSPEGKGKRVMSFVCSVVLLAGILRTLREPDWEAYALETAQLHQREEAFLENAEGMQNELQRIVIEEKCRSYILSKARQMQLDLEDASVTAQWSMEGIWIPYRAVLTGLPVEEERSVFSGILESELGIPRARQEWTSGGS